MSTRSLLGTETLDQKFRATYVHSDGYPSGLGRWLFDTYHRFFSGSAELMLRQLVWDHPGGWSVLAFSDYTLTPISFDNYQAQGFPYDPAPPVYYESRYALDFFTESSDLGWIEWAYFINSTELVINSVVDGGLRRVTAVAWDAPEPDWEAIEQQAREMTAPAVSWWAE